MSQHDFVTRTIAGFDGTAHGWRVLGWAAAEAAAHSVELLIVHCWQDRQPIRGTRVPTPPQSRTTPGAASRPAGRAAAGLLANAVARARAMHPGLKAEGQLIKRSPVTALLSVAQPGDTITVGVTSAHGDVGSDSDPDSTASRLLGRAPCDVMVVPPRADADEPGRFPGHVVALLGEPGAAASVLARAFSEAEARSRPLAIVHTVDSSTHDEPADRPELALVSGSTESTGDTDLITPWEHTHPGVTVLRATERGELRQIVNRVSTQATMLVSGRTYATSARALATALSSARCPLALPAPILVPYQSPALDIPAARTGSERPDSKPQGTAQSQPASERSY